MGGTGMSNRVVKEGGKRRNVLNVEGGGKRGGRGRERRSQQGNGGRVVKGGGGGFERRGEGEIALKLHITPIRNQISGFLTTLKSY